MINEDLLMPKEKKKTNKKSSLKANERKIALQILSAISMRADIASRLGMSYSDKRNLYEALGYKKDPTFNDYMAKYRRQDIARAIIDAPARASWRRPPRITESDEKETKFEKAWVSLLERCRVFHYLSRVDRLASIGSYAVLLIGFDDGNGFEREIKSAKNVLYLSPYSQVDAKIDQYVKDTKNERFGLPETYSIAMKTAGKTFLSKPTHWSRVIHVAEDCLDDNVEGMPRLEPVLNRLQDLELVAGGSAEMFWRGAFPGYGFKQDPNTTMQDKDIKDLQAEIDEYMHDLKRYIRTQGISIESLAQQVADPSKHFAILIDLIACAVRIPKRILLGSERGELASSQDERAWLDRIDERRKEHCEPVILRPFIDRLITVGALPKPAEGYTVDWPDLMAPGEKEIAEVGEIRSKALKAYVDAIGADLIVPPDIFLRKLLGFSQDDINQINLILGGIQKGEES